MIADGLPALEARLAHDLAQIALGGPDWTIRVIWMANMSTMR
jgi:hypothetical protein